MPASTIKLAVVAAMLLFLLSLGGIPFVAGFWAKLYVFLAGVEQGLLGLVFVGAVLTVVALYYYLLVARRMYIEAPAQSGSVKVDLPIAAASTKPITMATTCASPRPVMPTAITGVSHNVTATKIQLRMDFLPVTAYEVGS